MYLWYRSNKTNVVQCGISFFFLRRKFGFLIRLGLPVMTRVVFVRTKPFLQSNYECLHALFRSDDPAGYLQSALLKYLCPSPPSLSPYRSTFIDCILIAIKKKLIVSCSICSILGKGFRITD